MTGFLWTAIGFVFTILAGIAVGIVVLAGLVSGNSSFPDLGAGSVTLICKHCGKETLAHRNTCRYCNGELQ